MERLTGMDAAFFHMETPDMHMHVMGTIVVDPSTMPGGYSFQAIKDTVARRIHLIPPFRRRLTRAEEPTVGRRARLLDGEEGAPGAGLRPCEAEVERDLGRRLRRRG